MVRKLVIATALFAIAAPAWADTIVLKDGRTFNGTLTRQNEQLLIKTADGAVVPIPADSIQKITLDTAMTPAELAANEWSRLQPMIQKSTNLGDIVSLIHGFLAHFPDSPQTPAAAQALADFQAMKDNNYIKFRGRWLAKDQAEVMARQGDDKAREALKLYAASKLRDAVAAAQAAVAIDDQNAGALTVLGLASFKLNDVAGAKTYFTKLTDADPNNALAWNNLAVLAYQGHHESEALTAYTRTLQSAMDNRLILDNIAEIRLNYTGSTDSPAYRGLARIANQSEARVAAKMQVQGLFRYASTWVNKEDRDRLSGHPPSLGGQVTQVQQQYNAAQASLAAIDLQIRKTQEAVQKANSDYANANSVITYNTSRGMYIDPYYYNLRDAATADLQRANQQTQTLSDQRAQTVEAIRKLKQEVDRLTAMAAAHPNGTGTQRLMEPGDVENPPPPAAIDIPPKIDTSKVPSPSDVQSQYSSAPTPVGPAPATPIPGTNVCVAPSTGSGVVTITPPGGRNR